MDFSKPTQVGPFKMFLDPKDSIISRRLSKNQMYAPGMLREIQRLVKPGMAVIDVGAHIGWMSLWFGRMVGPDGHVVAIEADPDNFDLLKNNLGPMEWVDTLNYVVGESGHFRSFYKSPINTGDHSAYPIDKEGRKEIEICGARLDDLFRDDCKFDVIKIDTQGMETEVLRGAKRLLTKAGSCLAFVELSEPHLLASGTCSRDCMETLQRYGFTEFAIIGRTASQKMAPFMIEARARACSPSYIDIVAARK